MPESSINGSHQSHQVVLYTFPPVPTVYNISPFGIKVESFLRIKNIPYDIVYTTKFGPKGKIPYIDLINTEPSANDGTSDITKEVIPDSNVILDRLEQEFGCSDTMTPEQAATSHMMTRMLEEHTTQIGFYYRYCLDATNFMERLDLAKRFFHSDQMWQGGLLSRLFQVGMAKGFGVKMKSRGLASHSMEELWKFSEDDIRSISQCLGKKDFFLGGTTASRLDCIVFAHLSQFYYMPLDLPQKEFMMKQCPNLVQFMERFREKYWADWDSKCERKPNQKRLANNRKPKSRRYVAILSSGALVAGLAHILIQRMSQK